MNIFVSAAVAAAVAVSCANAAPPIEAYGQLPNVSSLDISPDGKRFAFLSHRADGEYFIISEYDKGAIAGGSTDEIKARNIYFANNNHAIIYASETRGSVFYRDKWENSTAYSFNIDTKKINVLLRSFKELYPAQEGLGRVIGVAADGNSLYMPAFIGKQVSVDPFYGVLKAELDSPRATVLTKGSQFAFDYFVSPEGEVIAREDFDDKNNTYRIFSGKGGDFKAIYEERNVNFAFGTEVSVSGVMPDDSALIVSGRKEGDDFSNLRKMAFDGEIGGELFHRDDASIASIIRDRNRRILGVRYGGVRPTYQFFDASLTQDMGAITNLFPQDSVTLEGWTEGMGKLLVEVQGGATAPSYMLYDRSTQQIARLAQEYDDISDNDINPVLTIEYKARDGLKIPAIITLPRGTDLGQNLPLIVMPHGGPSSRSTLEFNWQAQYFASRGYMVFEPNFRGSTGFGHSFLLAGYGEWGRKMQDDITDGVMLLTRKQWANPDRVCIVGASYGGYAALAGGAFTPDLYKCVVAVAPVAKLSAMLQGIKVQEGGSSSTYEYWSKLIGDIRDDSAKIKAISPADHAANFKAPVLLIHGKDDTVVPYGQSLEMESALKSAGKDVTLVTLKNEDHWLSRSETRLQALQAMDAFVSKNIGKP